MKVQREFTMNGEIVVAARLNLLGTSDARR